MAFIKVNLPFGDVYNGSTTTSTFQFKEDVSQINRNGQLSALNSIYFDNSLNPFLVRLTAEDTNWTALIPAGSQGWLSCVATVNSIISATLVDTTLLPVSINYAKVRDDINPQNIFLFNNIYINNSTGSTSNFPTPCTIFLSDSYHQNEILYPEPPIINAIGGPNSLTSNRISQFNWKNAIISGTTTSSGTLITGLAYQKFYCTNIKGFISPDATLAANGIEQIKLNYGDDSGSVSLVIFQYPLQTTPLSGTGIQFEVGEMGTIVSGSSSTSNASISIGTALASGFFFATLAGYWYPSTQS